MRFEITFYLSLILFTFNYGVSVMAGESVKTIVTFGDSTTAPRGKLKVYSDVLSEKLEGVKIINSGIGGNTTAMARARFQEDVLAHKPDITIIQFGINDSAVDVWKEDNPATEPRVSLKKYEGNILYFIKELKRINSVVILMTPNPLRWTDNLKRLYGKPPYDPDDEKGFNLFLDKYAAKVREIAKNEKLILIDVNKQYYKFVKENNITVDDMLLDGMHPNNTGQKLVADMLLDALGKNNLAELKEK